jgi:hypothetical protein
LGEVSILTKANTTSTSLRATVPTGVVKHLGLKQGDRVDWTIEFIGGRKVAVFSKMVDT